MSGSGLWTSCSSNFIVSPFSFDLSPTKTRWEAKGGEEKRGIFLFLPLSFFHCFFFLFLFLFKSASARHLISISPKRLMKQSARVFEPLICNHCQGAWDQILQVNIPHPQPPTVAALAHLSALSHHTSFKPIPTHTCVFGINKKSTGQYDSTPKPQLSHPCHPVSSSPMGVHSTAYAKYVRSVCVFFLLLPPCVYGSSCGCKSEHSTSTAQWTRPRRDRCQTKPSCTFFFLGRNWTIFPPSTSPLTTRTCLKTKTHAGMEWSSEGPRAEAGIAMGMEGLLSLIDQTEEKGGQEREIQQNEKKRERYNQKKR